MTIRPPPFKWPGHRKAVSYFRWYIGGARYRTRLALVRWRRRWPTSAACATVRLSLHEQTRSTGERRSFKDAVKTSQGSTLSRGGASVIAAGVVFSSEWPLFSSCRSSRLVLFLNLLTFTWRVDRVASLAHVMPPQPASTRTLRSLVSRTVVSLVTSTLCDVERKKHDRPHSQLCNELPPHLFDVTFHTNFLNKI